jgi:hypothetical protein
MTFLSACPFEARKRERESEKGNAHPERAIADLDIHGFLLSGN